MSKNIQITAESIKQALESNPTSLTGLWKALGGSGSVSGSSSKRMREAFSGIEEILAGNKAGTAKPEEAVVSMMTKRVQKVSQKPSNSPAKNDIPRHPKNPFRHSETGYGLLVDLIANAGTAGIGKEDLLADYCGISGKKLQNAKYDLAVINSAREDSNKRHRACADSFTIMKEGECFRIRFD